MRFVQEAIKPNHNRPTLNCLLRKLPAIDRIVVKPRPPVASELNLSLFSKLRPRLAQCRRNPLDPVDFRPAPWDNRDPLGTVLRNDRPAGMIGASFAFSIERGDIAARQNSAYNCPRSILNRILFNQLLYS